MKKAAESALLGSVEARRCLQLGSSDGDRVEQPGEPCVHPSRRARSDGCPVGRFDRLAGRPSAYRGTRGEHGPAPGWSKRSSGAFRCSGSASTRLQQSNDVDVYLEIPIWEACPRAPPRVRPAVGGSGNGMFAWVTAGERTNMSQVLAIAATIALAECGDGEVIDEYGYLPSAVESASRAVRAATRDGTAGFRRRRRRRRCRTGQDPAQTIISPAPTPRRQHPPGVWDITAQAVGRRSPGSARAARTEGNPLTAASGPAGSRTHRASTTAAKTSAAATFALVFGVAGLPAC